MGTITNKLIVTVSILFRVLSICCAQNIAAFFVFGDSLVEAGNNFYIDTVAKPVFPNGEELGFKDYAPPFLAPNITGDMILKGVNYASSGAGILQATGSIFGERICMDRQLDYFGKTRQDIISKIGAPAAQALLRNSLYFLSIGANDVLFGEYETLDRNSYTNEVVSNFKSQIIRLYNMDARKFAVAGVSKVGSIPFEIDTHICAQNCAESLNNFAKLLNSKLKSLVEDLTNSLAGSILIYVDNYAVTEEIINNSRSYGFENVDYACCEVIGRHGGLIPCMEVSRVCSDRKKYMFWDPFHPTESAILIAAKYILDGGELGFKNYAPPFLVPNTSGDMILKGVNSASSGAGILQFTGSAMGERICMDTQMDYFAKTRQDIISRIGAPAAQALLRNSLYFLLIGSNDILYGEYSILDVNQFVDEVVSSFKSQLIRLYNLDARKTAVSNAPKVGCMPFEIDAHICTHDCVASLNELAKLCNSKLKSMLEGLTKNLTGSTFVYVDNYAVTEDLIDNYRSYGFGNANCACCEVIGRHGGLLPCIPVSQVCPDRTKYVFWDPFHPTESAVLIGAKHLLDGGLKYVSPINIRQLVNS
ncbi:putative GDSL-like Lipase/Acylhydrolase superfamily protein [Hibiscus syriacus]|uniref:GDSL-like Lipase/Acylhydrolase superfamily protein n=1 Tax=Hibiscus syriacus TaxID=106335 RepID=A0A6A3BGN3_HIBSY|nr:putative GDSL-like Lipase/Acylhydrolase superfamily protein [Hibiscus syriacus]